MITQQQVFIPWVISIILYDHIPSCPTLNSAYYLPTYLPITTHLPTYVPNYGHVHVCNIYAMTYYYNSYPIAIPTIILL